jgi:hypothetical protein
MIRLNRFNLGKNPVATIDGLLRERLEGMLNDNQLHDVVAEASEKASEIEVGLKTGEYKRCKKCDRDLPTEMFFRKNAKTGMGRYCRDCRSQSPELAIPQVRRSIRRW